MSFKSKDKITLEEVIEVVVHLDKHRRMSNLHREDLKKVWMNLMEHAHQKLAASRKAFFIPGLGYFCYKSKQTDEYLFLPGHTWKPILDPLLKQITPRTDATETLNFSKIPSTYPKKNVESGIKEILLLLKEVVFDHRNLHLDLGIFGYLDTKSKPLTFKLRPKRSISPPSLPAETGHLKKEQDCINTTFNPFENNKNINAHQSSIQAVGTSTGTNASNSNMENNTNNSETFVYAYFDKDGKIVEQTGTALGLPSINGHFEYQPNFQQQPPEMDFDTPLDAPKFIIWSLATTHTHSFSGDRRWLNHNCGICKHISSSFHDHKAEDKDREMELDRQYLAMAEQDAKAFHDGIDEKQRLERQYMQMLAAENWKMAQNKKTEKTELPPLGDIFYNRPAPPNSRLLNVLNAKEVTEQIAIREKLRKEQEIQKLYEERMRSKQFLQQFRKEQEDAWIHKHNQQVDEQTALEYQIQHRNRGLVGSRFSLGNLFARDETPEKDYRRNYAVQVHNDQLLAMAEKKTKVKISKQTEKVEDQSRLSNGHILLQKDLEETRKIRFETRKYLEDCWKRQIAERVDEFA